MNNWCGIGNLGKDPVLRKTNSGLDVCSLFIVINREGANLTPPNDADGIPVTVWGASALACANNLKKGSEVGVHGRLQSRTWEQDGTTRFALEVNARRVEFLRRPNGAGPKTEAVTVEASAEPAPGTDDDIPF